LNAFVEVHSMSAQRPLNSADAPAIRGFVAPGFELVHETFAANFRRQDERREIGAALAIYRAGQCVVDLWGGTLDAAGRREWQRDSLVNVYSTTKGIVAACVALLVERGVLRYEDPVRRFWPEFAQNGKEDATIAQVMSHQVGLPAFEDRMTLTSLYDWNACCAALAKQAPRWVPGEKTGYHAVTYGYLAGEIVRRASGQTIGQFLSSQLAQPLQSEFHIGLPIALHGRAAELVAPDKMVDPTLMPFPEETRLAIANPPLQPAWANTSDWRSAELPALNGHASAVGVARIYALLANGGALAGSQLLSRSTLAQMTEAQPRRIDLTLGFELSWACGVAVNGSLGFYGPNPRSYGHSGWGGSFGCADPDRQLAIGYVCNKMGPDLVGDDRARGLCDALYECL
jgi:CubicO group peptidase (beta-lactamase class C family)